MSNNREKSKTKYKKGDDYINIIVFGSEGVGKTSLVNRFINGTFIETHLPTIENIFIKEITIHKIQFKIKIIDTCGSNILFPAVQRTYIQKGHAFVLLYSITDKKSFEDVFSILSNIMDIRNPGLKDFKKNNVPIVLCGTRLDEDYDRQVYPFFAEKIATDYNLAFMEISSKMDNNIEELFDLIIKLKINPKGNMKTVSAYNNNSNDSTSNNFKTKNSNEECAIM